MVEKQKNIRSRLKRNLLIVSVLAGALFISAAGYVSNLYGRFRVDFNKLGEAMLSGDSDAVERQVDVLIQYHELADRWYLGQFVDRYLLEDMQVYEAVNTLLKRDYWALMHDQGLTQKTNNHLIAHILGVARAKYYQSLYQEKLNQIKAKKGKMTNKDRADLKEILNKTIEEARPYFRLAVENSPGHTRHYEYPFNYDILQNEKSAQQALENPGEKEITMGYGEGKPEGQKPGGDRKGDQPNKLNPGNQPGGQNNPEEPEG